MNNVIQMNLLAETIKNLEGFEKAFYITVRGENTLNELHKLIIDNLVEQFKIPEGSVYRDFKEGGIRYSNANILKIQNFVGFDPTHDIYKGMEEAIGWYVEDSNIQK